MAGYRGTEAWMAVALRQSRRFDASSPVTRYWLANCVGFTLAGGGRGTVVRDPRGRQPARSVDAGGADRTPSRAATCPRRRSSPSSRRSSCSSSLVAVRRCPTGGETSVCACAGAVVSSDELSSWGWGFLPRSCSSCCSWSGRRGRTDLPSSRGRAAAAVPRRRGWYGQCRGSRTAVPRAPLRPGCRRRARVARRAPVRRHRAGAARRAPPDKARTTSST